MREDLDLTPAVRLLVGKPADIRELITTGQVRAVGPWRPAPNERAAVPVVYLTRRPLPVYRRRWFRILATGAAVVLPLAALVAWAILSLGLAVFLGLVIGIPAAGLVLAVWAKSRGGHSVSVTTITNVRIK